MNLNKIQLIGRLGRAPETKQLTNSGSTYTAFQIATTEKWKSQDGQQKERTTWHSIQAHGKLGEVCLKHLEGGQEVYVEGEQRHNEYEKDGQKRTFSFVRAKEVNFGQKSKSQHRDHGSRHDFNENTNQSGFNTPHFGGNGANPF